MAKKKRGTGKQRISAKESLFPELEPVRKALDALYRAVTTPLPESLSSSLDTYEEREKCIREGLEWQNNVARRFGQAINRSDFGDFLYSDGSLLASLSSYSCEDYPFLSLEQIVERMALQWPISEPQLHLGFPPDDLLMDRTIPVRDAKGRVIAGMDILERRSTVWPMNVFEVKLYLATSRQRALRLIHWTTEAIRMYESLNLPSFELTPTGDRLNVTVHLAGFTDAKSLSATPTAFLRKLKRNGTATESPDIKHDLIQQVPELDPWVESVPKPRAKRGQGKVPNRTTYQLHPEVRKRIKVNRVKR